MASYLFRVSGAATLAGRHLRPYPRRDVTARPELRQRGWRINHKRVARLMREDNFLAVQPRAFVATIDAQHELEVYLNLASRLMLTGINQLWVADIIYICLRVEFVYLAVILDGFSRKVMGWALDTTLAARLPLEALYQALSARHPQPGAVHHSDRGGTSSSVSDDSEHEPAGEPLITRAVRAS